MKDNYQYPIETYWNQEELIKVMRFYQAVEAAYETGIDTEKFKKAYRDFKSVVPAIGEEKRLSKEFEVVSDYSIYRAVKTMRETTQKRMKVKL